MFNNHVCSGLAARYSAVENKGIAGIPEHIAAAAGRLPNY
jgi:hypothetical protein